MKFWCNLSNVKFPGFLSQASVDLPSVVNFEPYNPRINVDSAEVISYHSSAVGLKEWIAKLLELPAERRIPELRPGVLV